MRAIVLLVAVLALIATSMASSLKVDPKCARLCKISRMAGPHCLRRCAVVSDVTTLSDSFSSVKCSTTSNLNVRTDAGKLAGSQLSKGAKVTVTTTKNMLGLNYSKIGNNRWVATKYLGSCGSAPKPAPSTGGVSVAQLQRIMPGLASSKANAYISHINAAMSWGQITTCARKSAFLAQLAHESGQLRYMEEIASGAAYEGRRDLGNIYPGDGKRYKGRGPIQLTGRANYRAAGKALGVDLEGNPTLAATPKWGFKIAAYYWKSRSLNQYADQNSQAGFDQITRRINGGYNGKADRDQFWRRAKSVLGC